MEAGDEVVFSQHVQDEFNETNEIQGLEVYFPNQQLEDYMTENICDIEEDVSFEM